MTATRTIPAGPNANAKSAGLPGRAGLFGVIMAALIALHDRARQRRHLRGLDDRQLRDVGLSRADVVRMTEKPFWTI